MDLGSLKNLDVKDLVEKLKGMDLMSNKKLLIKFGIGFVSILIFLIIYYFFVSPTVDCFSLPVPVVLAFEVKGTIESKLVAALDIGKPRPL